MSMKKVGAHPEGFRNFTLEKDEAEVKPPIIPTNHCNEMKKTEFISL